MAGDPLDTHVVLTKRRADLRRPAGEISFPGGRKDAEDVDLGLVVLGHSGDAVDNPDYLGRMAEAGLTLGMDRFGIDHFASFQQRCDLVLELCRRGYADRMVLSHDCSCYLVWFNASALAALKDWHYLHVSQDVVPYLRDHGVSDDQLDAMLVRTPARILAGRASG